MKSLCIKTNNYDWLQYLLNELEHFELEQICFSLRQFKHYKNIILHYTGTDEDLFFNKISSLLSLFVIDELEEDFLMDLKKSVEITKEWYARRRWWFRVKEAVARLISPML